MVGAISTLYGLWLCYAAKPSELLLTTLLFAPATLVYVLARRERGLRLFTLSEALMAAILTAFCAYALWRRFSGDASA